MLNEANDPNVVMLQIIVSAIAFLSLMWGAFYFFVRFKRKDDAFREKAHAYFKQRLAEDSSESSENTN